MELSLYYIRTRKTDGFEWLALYLEKAKRQSSAIVLLDQWTNGRARPHRPFRIDAVNALNFISLLWWIKILFYLLRLPREVVLENTALSIISDPRELLSSKRNPGSATPLTSTKNVQSSSLESAFLCPQLRLLHDVSRPTGIRSIGVRRRRRLVEDFTKWQ